MPSRAVSLCIDAAHRSLTCRNASPPCCGREFDMVVIGGGSGGLACGREVHAMSGVACAYPHWHPLSVRATHYAWFVPGCTTGQIRGHPGLCGSQPRRHHLGTGRHLRERRLHPKETHAPRYGLEPLRRAHRRCMRSGDNVHPPPLPTAGQIGQTLRDAPAFGWQLPAEDSHGHDWATMRQTVRLSPGLRSSL